jgi:hypothetical protein
MNCSLQSHNTKLEQTRQGYTHHILMSCTMRHSHFICLSFEKQMLHPFLASVCQALSAVHIGNLQNATRFSSPSINAVKKPYVS